MGRITAGLVVAALLVLALAPADAAGPLRRWPVGRQTVPDAPVLGAPTLGDAPVIPAAPVAPVAPAAPAAPVASVTTSAPVAPVTPVAPATTAPPAPATAPVAPATPANGTSTDSSGTLWGVISNGAGDPDNDQSDYDLFARAIRAANYQGVLTEATTSGVTVLAPSDAAFLRTATELGYTGGDEAGAYTALTQVLRNASGGRADALLFDVVGYHIIPSGMNADMLSAGRAETTYQGAKVVFDGLNVLQVASRLRNPTRVGAQVTASNGIMHNIDRLLFPIDIDPAAAATIANTAVAPGGEVPITADGNGSVIPAGARRGGGSVCFPANAHVLRADGTDIAAGSLVAGDLLAAPSSPSPVFLFTHRTDDGLHEFVRLSAGLHTIALSAAHYVYANGELVRADAVRRGDVVRTVSGPQRVRAVSRVWERGLVAPHTLQGDIVVGGIVASTYTALFPPQVVHAILAPVRAVVVSGLAREPLGEVFYDGAPKRDAVSAWLRSAAHRAAPMALFLRAVSL